jgi:hypothetical protein
MRPWCSSGGRLAAISGNNNAVAKADHRSGRPKPSSSTSPAVILVDLQDFTPSIKRTRPKTGEPSPVSGRDRPEHLRVTTVGLADLA